MAGTVDLGATGIKPRDIIFSGGGIIGTNTNDSTTTGFVGEYITISGGASFPATTVWGDVVTISLTAGDWDVSLCANAIINGSTTTAWDVGISITSGNSTTGLARGDNWLEGIPPTATFQSGLSIPAYRLSLAGTTTVYFKFMATYSAGTPQISNGRLSARRVR